MARSEASEAAIRRSAGRGARSATRNRRLQHEAIETTMDRWADAVLRATAVRDGQRWAFRVAANAARSFARRAGSARVPHPMSDLVYLRSIVTEVGDDEAVPAARQRVLRALLARQKKKLRGRQLEIVQKLAEPGMTFHRAAKELAMARYNLKRSFRSALRRLAKG